MTLTPPRKGSVDGLHGLPSVDAKRIRVLIAGDMLRGVVSYDCDEGWADVLVWGDDGNVLHDGENFVTQRRHGVVEVRGV
jgi:hypothetical protein